MTAFVFRNNELKQACAPEDKLEWFGYFSKFIRLTQQFFFLFCLYFVYTQFFVPEFPSTIGINLFSESFLFSAGLSCFRTCVDNFVKTFIVSRRCILLTLEIR